MGKISQTDYQNGEIRGVGKTPEQLFPTLTEYDLKCLEPLYRTEVERELKRRRLSGAILETFIEIPKPKE
jgi:hypothetical protein